MSMMTLCRSLAISVALAAASGGCSWVFVDGPPAAHKQLPYFECTSSNAWPVVDTVFGVATALEAATLLASTRSSGANTAAAVAAGEAVIFGASAVSGYQKTSSCREAKAELLQRLYRLPSGPGMSPGFSPGLPPAQPYDPWLSPRPGAFSPSLSPGPARPAVDAGTPSPAPGPGEGAGR